MVWQVVLALKTIPISYLRECLALDECTNSLTWLRRPAHHFATRGAFGNWNTKYAGRRADLLKTSGYRAVAVRHAGKTRHIPAHRVIWALAYGAWPMLTIDHVNGNRMDNRLVNLRDVSSRTNAQNRRAPPSSKKNALPLGVRHGNKNKFRAGKFRAGITVDGKHINLGTFDTAEKAHGAYLSQCLGKPVRQISANLGPDASEQQEQPLNVYQKLNAAREEFHSLKLEKTGHNKFAGYYYFELGDFLIQALKVFKDVGLCAIVSFENDYASMAIVDVDKPEGLSFRITSPMGSAALKGCHEVQNIGAVETYQRRYLWVTALEIVEHDALDATTGNGKAVANIDTRVSATEEAWKRLQPETQDRLRIVASQIVKCESASRMLDVLAANEMDNDEKAGLWHLLDSKTRAAIKNAQKDAA